MSNSDFLLGLVLGKSGGGGGGGDISVVSLSVSANGTYSAPSGKAYSPVSVNVAFPPSVSVVSLSVAANGTYSASSGYAYDPVTVDVPNSYSAADEGKVVSSGALVGQTSSTVTQNGTVNTTLISSLTVNVSGGGGGGTEAEDGIIMRTISGAYENSRVTEIGVYTFYSCTSLTAVSFPNCATIGSSAFYGCSGLTTISFPACTSIGSSAFANCYSLALASFPACTSIGSSAFANCSGLTAVSLPSCTVTGNYAFYSCTNLTAASFPACTSIGSSTFQNCSGLTTVSLPVCTSIGTYAFRNCRLLISLYLMGSSVATLGTSVFTSTPIGGYSASAGQFGSVFVPQSLLASYQAETNWASISSRIVGV